MNSKSSDRDRTKWYVNDELPLFAVTHVKWPLAGEIYGRKSDIRIEMSDT